MSCAAPPTYRLLDGYVGWDAEAPNGSLGLDGLGEGDALQLAIVGGGVALADLLAYLPPPALARGCGPCDWYLVTPAPGARVLRRGCDGFQPVRGTAGFPGILVAPVAIAARRHRIAVADPGAGEVRVWTQSGRRTAAVIAISQPLLVALASGNELLVVDGAGALERFGANGDPRGSFSAPLPPLSPGGAYDRIGVGNDCAVWLVTRAPAVALDGTATTSYHLWRALPGDTAFVPATIAALAAAFAPTRISAASAVGFCFAEPGPDGIVATHCWDWHGVPLAADAVAPTLPPLRERRGQLLTVAIDGGIPRCRWHRLRLDATVPLGATIEIAVSTSEEANPPSQGVASPPWQLFPAGLPHPDDWQTAPAGALDFLVDQPPGRFLFVRLRLVGDGVATPLVRRVRLDLPRVTSLDYLPPVYREDANAADFTERFLSLFDATVGDINRAIERAPALLDAGGVPEAALPWLAGFLDIVLDPAWSTAQRRAIIAAAPELYRKRGTVAGLVQTLALVTGAPPFIDELSRGRMWGALGRTTRLQGTRLYGRSRARVVLDRSPLGQAPVRSFGSVEQDPFAALAFRFRVLMPPAPGLFVDNGTDRLQRLVAAQKPAHTAATVRVGGSGFIVGVWANVGVDSVFASLPPPTLGARGNVRLSRMSVLWPGRDGRAGGAAVGATSAVGMTVSG